MEAFPIEFDVYLVPRVDGLMAPLDESATLLGTVTVNPDAVPLGATPMDHAIEVINKHIPRSYNHED